MFRYLHHTYYYILCHTDITVTRTSYTFLNDYERKTKVTKIENKRKQNVYIKINILFGNFTILYCNSM